MRPEFYYTLSFQYLGFRYHGWQKQNGGPKTVQLMLEKTTNFILEEKKFKLLGSSRTDAMVSCEKALAKLTLFDHIDPNTLLEKYNQNLPQDIRMIAVKEESTSIDIIGCPKVKEYHYYFSFGEKFHPFAAPFMTNFREQLDIDKMQEAARLFIGSHRFSKYCFRPNEAKKFERKIDDALLVKNTFITGNFIPESSYVFIVKGEGFMRNQIRLMMGALVLVGSGKLSMEDFKASLLGKDMDRIPLIAPASGLILKDINLSL